ncbi:MAG TPA: PAS domain S-box protein [Clostridia bacterium]|nr:PAS domain S-box protein [Clostridia bacterium]
MGSIVFIGWIWNIPRLQTLFSSRIIVPNSAVCFLFSGIALYIYGDGQPGRLRWVARVLSAIVAVVGLLTLIQYFTGSDLKLDRLFLAIMKEWPLQMPIGRMAPNTALAFLLLGLSLLAIEHRPDANSFSEYFAAMSGFIGTMGLLGYLYAVPSLYGFGSVVDLSPHTAFGLLVLAVGVLLARPQSRFCRIVLSPYTAGIVTRRLLTYAVTGVIVLGWIHAVSVRSRHVDPEFSAAALISLSVVFFSVILLNMARVLDQLDQQRLEALRDVDERREWFSTTLNSIGDAVIATDVHGDITFMNPVAERLTGWPIADAFGKSLTRVFAVVNQLTHEPVENPVVKVLQINGVVNLANHTVLISRDGTETPIDDSGAPIRNSQKKIIGVVLVFRDVRERNEAEQNTQRLASIVESSQDAIIGKTLEGIIVSWNAGAERMYGYTPDEVVGKHISMLSSPDHRPEFDSIFNRLRNGERIDHFETIRRRKSGEEFWASLSISPIRDVYGRIAGASTIARDITAAKRSEEVLRSTEKLAAAGRIAAVMAHEINNPLEAITNLNYLLQRHPSLDEEARKYVEISAHELTRVSHISKQTLAFYRESSQPIPLCLREVVESVIEFYAHRAQQSKITIETRFDSDGCITAFPGEMRQVVSNLLVNAIDALGRGGRIVLRVSDSIDWSQSSCSGARIAIADNGPGIPVQYRDRVFEPFFTTKGQKGTGLGLWVTQGIVSKHRGSIRLRSSAGKHHGTCFSVFIPAAVAEELPAPLTANTGASAS